MHEEQAMVEYGNGEKGMLVQEQNAGKEDGDDPAQGYEEVVWYEYMR